MFLWATNILWSDKESYQKYLDKKSEYSEIAKKRP